MEDLHTVWNLCADRQRMTAGQVDLISVFKLLKQPEAAGKFCDGSFNFGKYERHLQCRDVACKSKNSRATVIDMFARKGFMFLKKYISC